MLRNFWNDDCGFIVSAELVLVATILVIGMIVGLSQVQHAVVQELADVACAIGSLNQSYGYTGFSAKKTMGGAVNKSTTKGSSFVDGKDECDCLNGTDIACNPSQQEGVCGNDIP